MRHNNSKRKYQTTIEKTKDIKNRSKKLESIKNLTSKNINAGRREILHYLEEYPNDMFGYFHYGHIEEMLGNLDHATEIFTAVANSDWKNKYSAIIRLGDIASKKGDISKARTLYTKAINESSHEEVYALQALATLERSQGNYAKALAILEKISLPTDKIKLEKVKLIALAGNAEKALKMISELAQNSTISKRELTLVYGRVLRQIGDKKSALYYLESIKEYPLKDDTYYEAIYELARILEETDTKTAIAYCEELISTDNLYDRAVYVTLGFANQRLGEYANALKCFKEATKSTDTEVYSNGYYQLGCLQYLMGEYEQAEHSLQNSIVNQQNISSALCAKLIGVYIKQGKYQQADAFLQKVIQINGDFLKEHDFTLAKLLIAKKLGRSLPPLNRCSYGGQQIIDYSKDRTLDHIKKYHVKRVPDKTTFSPDIDIEKLYSEAVLQMNDANRINSDIMDFYALSYPNCGYDQENNISNSLIVITIPGTTNIINMYPAAPNLLPTQGEILSKIESEKRPSKQISKFNARFEKSNNYKK